MSRARYKPRRGLPPKLCRICLGSEGPWTEEDAYPQWLRKHVVEQAKQLPADALVPGWEPLPRVKLKKVCEACQRKLNVEIESPATSILKRILQDDYLDFAPGQVVRLACWIVKTDLTLALARAGGPYAMTGEREGIYREVLRTMLEVPEPPADCVVRVARIAGDDSGEPFFKAGFPRGGLGLHSIHVIAPNFLSETLIGRGYDEVVERHDPRFLYLWPSDEEPFWPPQRGQFGGTDAIERLRAVWKHHPDNRLGDFGRKALNPDYRVDEDVAPGDVGPSSGPPSPSEKS